jgi:hypothetical protein
MTPPDPYSQARAELAALPRPQLLLLNVLIAVAVITHLVIVAWAVMGYGDKSSLWDSHKFSYKLAPAYIHWMPVYVVPGYWLLLYLAVRLCRKAFAAQRCGDSTRATALDGLAVIVALLGLVVVIGFAVVSITLLSHLPRGHPYVPHHVAFSFGADTGSPTVLARESGSR